MVPPLRSRFTTSIPPRYRLAREDVLRILARWEESTRRALGEPLGPGSAAGQQ